MLDPYFQKAEGRKLKAIRNFIYWKIFENRVVNNADALFFTCDEELRLAHQSFHPFIPKKEIVVGLGVDAPPAYSMSMTKAFLNFCPGIFGRPYFLFLSRVHEKKGVDILIKAYRQILNKVTGGEIEVPALVVAGPGLESDFGKEMMQIVSEEKNFWVQFFFQVC
jgi:glycosyltransferase involved in cell wall biosynthesis